VDGLELGPLAQLDLPLGGRAFLRFETALLYRWFKSAPSVDWQDDQWGKHLHVLGGGGFSF
jgi:hypothetical protein